MSRGEGVGPITPRSPSPEPVGPSKRGSLLSRFVTSLRGKGSGEPTLSFEEVAGLVNDLKNRALSGQGQEAAKALEELTRLGLHFTKLAEGGDSEVAQIASHVTKVLVFIEIEKVERKVSLQSRSVEIAQRFKEGPVDDVLGKDVEIFFKYVRTDPTISEESKTRFIHVVLEGALQACEGEKELHRDGPSQEFYVRKLSIINNALLVGLSASPKSDEERQTLIDAHQDVLEWFQRGQESFFATIEPQRHESTVVLPQRLVPEPERQRVEAELFEGLTIKQQRTWLKEFAKFGPEFMDRMRREIDRAGPADVEVNGQRGVVPQREAGQKWPKEFAQWCQVLERSIAKVPEDEKPKWRAAIANLMLAATDDMYDLLASVVHEGLGIKERQPLEFKGTPTGCSLIVDVEKGTCTLQRRRDVTIAPLDSPKTPISRLQMQTDQQVSVDNPTSVRFSVQYGATCDVEAVPEIVQRAQTLQARLQSEPITGELIEEVEGFRKTCKDEGIPQDLVQTLALCLVQTAIRRCDQARREHPDHPTAEDYYTAVSVLRNFSNLLPDSQQKALLSQNPEIAEWLQRGRKYYATPREKTVEQFSIQPTLREKKAATIDLGALTEEKRAIVEEWLPYFPDPDEVTMSICRGDFEEIRVNGKKVVEGPIEAERGSALGASERLVVFCRAAEALFNSLASTPGSDEDKKKAVATLIQSSIMHNIPGDAIPIDIGISLGMDAARMWGAAIPLSPVPQYVCDPDTGMLSVEFKHETYVIDAHDPTRKTPFLLTSKATVDVKDPATANWTFSWEQVPAAQ